MTTVAAPAYETHPAGESEYRRQLRLLEAAADKLERGDLDPEDALRTYREALVYYESATEILNTVKDEFRNLEEGQEGEAPTDGGPQP